ncbi:caspase family protein [Comamonas sp.]|uniref:caspase family protein n=1 Tax=Comamonas sp. TaxID=34028 RepID=UPI00258304E4|nr:caspase family protein [Comamonas sp.]
MADLRFLYKTHYGVSRALVIGIDTYKTVSPLGYAVSDATAIKEALIADLGFAESEVTLLTNAGATKEAIQKAFQRFAKDDVGLDDKVVVFFAGHGHTRTGIRGEVGYLVPHDANLNDFSTFIRWDEFTRDADLIRAKHMLFIMDACYGGLALVRTASAGSTRFLKDMLLRTSRQVLTAGKADQVVADSGGPLPNHSVFTGHLIEAIQGKATTPDGVLTASGIMSYVYAKVAKDKNSNQTPHYGHVDGDGDMILKAPGLGNIEEIDTKDLDRLVSIPYPDLETEVNNSEIKVEKVKQLLSSQTGAIGLHDLLSTEVKRFLAATADDAFAPTSDFSQDALVTRLARYEETTLDLSVLLACVSQWGGPQHLTTLQKCLARSRDRLESTNGLSAWLALRWYPLLMELYCCGVAAIDAGRFDSLAAIFGTRLSRTDSRFEFHTFIEAASDAVLELNRSNVLKHIPGHERNYTPLSEYLLKILQPKLDDALFLGKNYETAFETFEVYFALCAGDAELAKGSSFWCPIGRFGWKRSALSRVVKDGELQQDSWPPLKAGLFGGDFARFKKVADELQNTVNRLGWY